MLLIRTQFIDNNFVMRFLDDNEEEVVAYTPKADRFSPEDFSKTINYYLSIPNLKTSDVRS